MMVVAGNSPPDAHGAARTEFGLNAEPSYRPWRWAGGPNPDSWWDPATGHARVDLEMPLIRQSNATWVRIEFPWAWIEPQKGVFDWTHANYIVNSAASHNLLVEAVLVFCPSWEGAPDCLPDPSDWGQFLTEFATHFDGKIQVYDLWNEPDAGNYLKGSGAQYVSSVVIPGVRAIKAVNPKNLVLVEQASGDPGFIDVLKSAGAQFDIYAWHNYGGAASANRESFKLRDKLDSAGYTDAALWLDEIGVPDGTGDIISALLDEVMRPGANAATSIKFYNLRDDATYGSARSVIHWDQFGLMSNSNYGVMSGPDYPYALAPKGKAYSTFQRNAR
jgi:hypothetical protein